MYIDDDMKGNVRIKNKLSCRKKDKPDKMQMQQGSWNAKPQNINGSVEVSSKSGGVGAGEWV